MTCTEFNALNSREKWDLFFSKKIKGRWACRHCGAIMSDGPNRARPMHGCSVNCGKCDEELTRRTGGGMMDSFDWILLPVKNGNDIEKIFD